MTIAEAQGLAGEASSSAFRTNSVMMIAQAFVQRLMGALSVVTLAHILGPTLLGAFSITGTTANAAYGISRLGIDMGVHVAAAHEDPAQIPEGLSRILGAGLLAMLGVAGVGLIACVALAMPIASILFGKPQAAAFVAIGGLLLFGQAIAQFAYVAFGGLHRFGGYAAAVILGAPAVTLATVGAALGFGATGAACAAALGQLVLGATLLLVLRRTARRGGVSIRPRLDIGALHRIMSVGFPFYTAGLLLIPVDYLAQGALVRTGGLSTLGDLRVVMTASALVTFLPTAVNGPMISAMSRAHADGGDTAQTLLLSLRTVWTIGLASALALGLFWPVLAYVVFGAEYRDAQQYGILGVIGAVGLCLRHVLANGLLSFGRQRMLLGVAALESIVFGLTAVAAIPALGLGGYLVAQAAGIVAPLAAAAAWIPRAGFSAHDHRQVSTAAALSILSLGAVAWPNLVGSTSPLAWTIAGVMVLASGFLWAVLVLTRTERQAICRLGRPPSRG